MFYPESVTSSAPWTPFGLALLDHLEGQEDGVIEVLMEDGRRDLLPTSTLFRTDGFPDAELLALELASGRILDVGAGAGPHALALQENGSEVVALDVCSEAVEVMRRRRIRKVHHGDLLDLESQDLERLDPEKTCRERLGGIQGFDTVLLLMNGLGMAGDLPGLRRLLLKLHTLIRPGGSILADSSDLRLSDDPRELRLVEKREREGRYWGSARMQMLYRSIVGASFLWLFIDLQTLQHEAEALGWKVQPIFEDPEGPFLVRLATMP